MNRVIKDVVLYVTTAAILASNYYVIANQLTVQDVKFAIAQYEANKAEAIEAYAAAEPEPAILSDEDREYIARVCMTEAGNSLNGMKAVAQTIRDRGDYWDCTYIEAAAASGQYAEPNWDEPISGGAMAAVRLVFDYQESVLEIPTTHFHSDSIPAPYWADDKTYRGEVGGNKFYY